MADIITTFWAPKGKYPTLAGHFAEKIKMHGPFSEQPL